MEGDYSLNLILPFIVLKIFFFRRSFPKPTLFLINYAIKLEKDE